jgi:hypothetical protein
MGCAVEFSELNSNANSDTPSMHGQHEAYIGAYNTDNDHDAYGTIIEQSDPVLRGQQVGQESLASSCCLGLLDLLCLETLLLDYDRVRKIEKDP